MLKPAFSNHASAKNSSDTQANYSTLPLKCLVVSAHAGNQSSQELLLERFMPLIKKCVQRARLSLPCEDSEIVLAEARYLFLVLLKEFNPDKGVPFEGYIKAKLDLRLFNWCHLEQKRWNNSMIFDECDFEARIYANYLNSHTSWGGG